MDRLSIFSFINIPMLFESELVGYIGFDSVHEETDCSDEVRYNAWLKDAEGNYVAVNRHFLSTFQKNSNDVIESRARNLFSEKFTRKIAEDEFQVLRNRQRYVTELQVSENPDVWHKVFLSPIVREDGSARASSWIRRQLRSNHYCRINRSSSKPTVRIFTRPVWTLI